MLNFIKTRLKRAETERELNMLSNRELNDLGISRHDIKRIAREIVM